LPPVKPVAPVTRIVRAMESWSRNHAPSRSLQVLIDDRIDGVADVAV
jgi:hypothetical protein